MHFQMPYIKRTAAARLLDIIERFSSPDSPFAFDYYAGIRLHDLATGRNADATRATDAQSAHSDTSSSVLSDISIASDAANLPDVVRPSDGSSFAKYAHGLLESELSRLLATQSWRLSAANVDYSLCETYPAYVVCPAVLNDAQLRQYAAYYVNGRLPVWCWSHPYTSCALLRGSVAADPAGASAAVSAGPSDPMREALVATCGDRMVDADLRSLPSRRAIRSSRMRLEELISKGTLALPAHPRGARGGRRAHGAVVCSHAGGQRFAGCALAVLA